MTTYAGTTDEDHVSAIITHFGDVLEDAGEVGFVLTYHAEPGGSRGIMDLAGKGLSHAQLAVLLAEALEHDAEHGSTR